MRERKTSKYIHKIMIICRFFSLIYHSLKVRDFCCLWFPFIYFFPILFLHNETSTQFLAIGPTKLNER